MTAEELKQTIRSEIERRIKVCEIVSETRDNEIAQALFEGIAMAYKDMLAYLDNFIKEETKVQMWINHLK